LGIVQLATSQARLFTELANPATPATTQRIRPEELVFVDLGSGKGRPVLVASEFPFRRVIGVEFAKQLHDIATRNGRRYVSSTQRCRDVLFVHGDAIDYRFDEVPTVVFMFNPFRPAVLAPVLRNLQKSIESSPRDVILLYASPYYGRLVEQETSLRFVVSERYHNLYRFSPSKPLNTADSVQ
jgi:SAM-dependent methyltransferase